jgi:hypothetical protein
VAALYIPNVKLMYGAVTNTGCCTVDSIGWPCKLTSKLRSLQVLTTTEGIFSQVEASKQSTNELLTQRTRAFFYLFSNCVLRRVGNGSLIHIRKLDGFIGFGMEPTWVLMVCVMESRFVHLILPCKSLFMKGVKSKMIDKNETLGWDACVCTQANDFTCMQKRKPIIEWNV